MAFFKLVPGISDTAHALLLAGFGCVMLIYCVKEIRRDKRPIWLATWLAASISIAIYIGRVFLFDHNNPMNGQYLINLAIAGIWSLAALLAFWNSPRWRFAVIFLVIVSVTSVAFQLSLHFAAGMIITGFIISLIPIKMLVPLKIFAWHKHGSLPQVSLFLYGLTHFSITFPHYKVNFGLDFWLIPIIVIIFARSSTWGRKFAALAMGVVLSAVTIFVIPGFTDNMLDTLCNFAIGLPMAGLFILWPMLYDYWQRRKRPEFVR